MIENILQALAKVKQTSANEWVACCPAHDDRTPSLAIKQTDDGRVLLHCFSGCVPIEILNVLGLTYADLFPRNSTPLEGLKSLRWSSRTMLEAIAHNAMCLVILADDLAHGREALTPEYRDQIFERAMEIQEAVNHATR